MACNLLFELALLARMSEDDTKVLKDRGLEQVLAKLEVMDSRLQRVELNVEKRGFDTKPIWERALSEISEVKQDVGTLKQDMVIVKQELGTLNRKMDLFNRDMLSLRADQLRTEERVDRLVGN